MNQTVSAIHPRLTNRGGEAPHQCPPTRAIGLLNNSIQNKTKVHSVTKGHNQRLVMFPYHSHSWKQHKRTVFGRVIGSHSWGIGVNQESALRPGILGHTSRHTDRGNQHFLRAGNSKFPLLWLHCQRQYLEALWAPTKATKQLRKNS